MKYVLLILSVAFYTHCLSQTMHERKGKVLTVEDLSPVPKQEVERSAHEPGDLSYQNKAEARVIKTTRDYKKTYTYQYDKYLDDLVLEFHQRMEDNIQMYKKINRISKRPQYSDPSYFGHKRKPKIRPVGKKKMCEECGIRH
ncbi:MAG: hypothetical protein OEY34_02310 [Cyclobacteriaceae bacterium]|nr:hypothetical protein [Cyclobacteriaceae bacterium]